MTSDQIADYVVAQLNALEDPLLRFTAEKPLDVTLVEAERDTFGVFVCPKSETETPFDNGDDCHRVRVVSVVLNGPAKTATLGDYCRAHEQLRDALIGTDAGENYTWDGNEVVSLWDYAALRRGRFLAQFDVTYSAFA